MEIQKKRILIVEDDLTYGTMMQTWLGKKGYDVERVTRVSDAVKALIGSKLFFAYYITRKKQVPHNKMRNLLY